MISSKWFFQRLDRVGIIMGRRVFILRLLVRDFNDSLLDLIIPLNVGVKSIFDAILWSARKFLSDLGPAASILGIKMDEA